MTSHTKAILFAVAAVIILSVQDGVSKYLSQRYPAELITMIRYWAFAVFATLLAARSTDGLRNALFANRPILQIARGFALAAQITLTILSFAAVGLAATHSIFAATPIVVALLSIPILGEAVGWHRWVAICVGFLGILFIVNPLSATFNAKFALPLAGMLLYAVYSVLTRLASRSDTSMSALLYTGVAGAVFTTIFGLPHWRVLDGMDWLWMIALCISSSTAHYLLILAYQRLQAVVVQPISYLQTVIVCVIGVTTFDEVMTINMLAGCVVVVAAGSYAIWREATAQRRVSKHSEQPTVDSPK